MAHIYNSLPIPVQLQLNGEQKEGIYGPEKVNKLIFFWRWEWGKHFFIFQQFVLEKLTSWGFNCYFKVELVLAGNFPGFYERKLALWAFILIEKFSLHSKLLSMLEFNAFKHKMLGRKRIYSTLNLDFSIPHGKSAEINRFCLKDANISSF